MWRHALDGPMRSARRGRMEAEFHGLRDWRSGDSQRWIHWRATARHGDLIVREFEHQEHHDLVVVLDLSREAGDGRSSVELVERAVSLAATLVAEACAQVGSGVSLVVVANHLVQISGMASAALREEMLDALAEVEAVTIATPCDRQRHDEQLERQLEQAGALARPRTPIVLVSTRPMKAVTAVAAASPAGGSVAMATRRVTQISAADDSWRQYVLEGNR
jgi:uncharacterized protein (DUF58 family)